MAKKKKQTTDEENADLRKQVAALQTKLALIERGNYWAKRLPLFGTLAEIIEEMAKEAACDVMSTHEACHHDVDY